MKDLFYMGGALFMGTLSILLILMLAYAILHLIALLNPAGKDLERIRSRLVHIRSIGLFSLVTGILGQLIGLYMAFSAIERAKDISPAIMFGGLKVSMITTLYGMIIFLLSILIWLILDLMASKQA